MKLMKMQVSKKSLKDDMLFHVVRLVSADAPYNDVNAEVLKHGKVLGY